MIKVAAISGGLGDAIYALQVCKALDVSRLLIKDVALENGSTTFKSLERLVRSQGIELVSIEGGLPFQLYPVGTAFDYDLDSARRQPRRDKNHILLSFRNQFGFKYDITKPWLEVPLQHFTDMPADYNLIFLTQRWRDHSRVDWNKVLLSMEDLPIYFLGFKHDWLYFQKTYPAVASGVRYQPTPDLFAVAALIRMCNKLYCNQNPALAIAQGIGNIPYSCEFKPMKTNTRLRTSMEVVLK